jgi:type II secretory pathway component PulJ
MTVVELMIALAILAIVMSAVYSAFSFQRRAVEVASEGRDASGQGLVILDRLTRDLSGVWLPRESTAESKGSYYLFEAEAKKLDFPTTSSLSPDPTPGPEVVEVGYRLEDNEEEEDQGPDKYLLIRRQDDTPDDNPLEGGRDIVLTRDLVSLEIKYLGSDGEETETWHAVTADRLPRAVNIKVVLSTVKDQEETYTTRVFLPLAQPVVTRVELPSGLELP